MTPSTTRRSAPFPSDISPIEEPQEMKHSTALTSSANVPPRHHPLRASYARMAARFPRPPVLSPNNFQRPASKIATVAGLANNTGRAYSTTKDIKATVAGLAESGNNTSGAYSTTKDIKATVAGLAESGNNTGRAYSTTKDIKAALYRELQGINRGIFGMASAKKSAILNMVELLESRNPTPQPTDYLLDKVDGCWKLIYSSITILGVKRTKLGLRDFISLGDFIQIIDVTKGRAANVIKFNVSGFNMLSGHLTIEASFKIASKTRVNIKLENSHITPEQLMNLFQKNYDLLLAIFNPDGWLEITYVDDSMRIGRDDKGNVFVAERSELEKF